MDMGIQDPQVVTQISTLLSLSFHKTTLCRWQWICKHLTMASKLQSLQKQTSITQYKLAKQTPAMKSVAPSKWMKKGKFKKASQTQSEIERDFKYLFEHGRTHWVVHPILHTLHYIINSSALTHSCSPSHTWVGSTPPLSLFPGGHRFQFPLHCRQWAI